jgi:serine/threonine protein phosphatase PrpC
VTRHVANATVQEIRFHFARDLAAAESFDVAGGCATWFTTRCPEKPTPNEDALALVRCDNHRTVLALADGFGGQPAGDQAAQLALTALADAVSQAVLQQHSIRAGILDGFERANQAVIGLGVGAATTLAAVELDATTARPYHVGDSTVLIVGQRGRVAFQTLDHSPVGYGLEAGLIAADDALHHAERHLVSNMVGAADMRIDVGPLIRLKPRDTLLLASDGVFDNLRVTEVVDCIRSGPLPRVARDLVAACHARMRLATPSQPGKPDDLSFALFRPVARSGRG